MPPRKIKVPYGGESRDAVECHVDSMHENINTYQLDDGSVVSLRTVVVGAARVVGEYNSDGDPIYVVRHQTLISVSPPENLRRKGE